MAGTSKRECTTLFYGGKLLSHLSALPPEEAQQAISLLRLNRNLIAIIDSDRRHLKGGRFRADINATKRRIIEEARSVGGYVWVTEGKEIENYLSENVLEACRAVRFVRSANMIQFRMR